MSVDLKNLDFGRIVEAIQNEITTASATIKEKTINRFMRPIVIMVAFVFASYQFVYAPPEKKAAGLQRRIDAAKRTSEYADSYKTLHDQIQAVYDKLPQPKDRERWLTDTLVAAIKADGLIADSIVPPDEAVAQGFAKQTVSVSITAKFSEIYALLRRIEATKPALHIEGLRIEKGEKLETVQVNCTVGTIVPLQKAQ